MIMKQYNVFLFVDLTTLGTYDEFDWLVYEVEFQNVSTTNCNLQKWWFCVLTCYFVKTAQSKYLTPTHPSFSKFSSFQSLQI